MSVIRVLALHSSILPHPASIPIMTASKTAGPYLALGFFGERYWGGGKIERAFHIPDGRRALSQVVCKTALHALLEVACPSFDISHLFTFVTVMQNT